MLRRNRSRGSAPRRNNNNGHSNNGRSHNSGVYERPESRPRYGVASQNYERYMNQAKDALSSGDRVQAEFFYQHADHYLRILNEYKEQQRQQQTQHQEVQADKDAAAPVADDIIEPQINGAGPEANADTDTVKTPPRRQNRKPRAKVNSTSSEGTPSAE
jgi:hypothetical protein